MPWKRMGSGGIATPLLTSALDGGEWSASRSCDTHWMGRPQSRYGRYVEKSCNAENGTRAVQPVSCLFIDSSQPPYAGLSCELRGNSARCVIEFAHFSRVVRLRENRSQNVFEFGNCGTDRLLQGNNNSASRNQFHPSVLKWDRLAVRSCTICTLRHGLLRT
jgi:hypothetical protein